MAENHDLFSGVVRPDCACTPEPDDSSATALPLPEQCYSPAGRDCTWYRECLERKHSCTGHQAGYAIRYAEKFCQLYGDHYNSFSDQGQQWVDGVRKCLQVSLVPMIRPYYNGDCADIKRQAFASHAPCYVAPGFGAPSMCQLGSRDWFTAFWTIKDAFLTSDALETLTGILDVMIACPNHPLTGVAVGVVGDVAFTVSPFGTMVALLLLLHGDTPNRPKRDADEPIGMVDRFDLAAKVTDAVSAHLQWNHDQLDWFTFVQQEDIEASGGIRSNVSVHIWLITKKASVAVDLGQEIGKFQDWIASGRDGLRLEVNGTHFEPTSLSVCDTTDCGRINSTVIAAPAPPPTVAATATVFACSATELWMPIWLAITFILLAMRF
ncbi:hypothetical protein BV898_10092 [Hypsibius exemplaris]|uniref:Uncharacterized protein n=1 Tax=Hypsibius exemplaris TaxID=2072580 RepID=A0A1W0WKM3_HYPEX|nr:hypothetical protein BV898_10092 [Hypsibius exemplaris]